MNVLAMLRLTFSLLATSGLAQAQTTWFVSEQYCSSQGTGSADDPLCGVQEGISMARDGDVVFVFAGVYRETINFEGKAISVIGESPETTLIDAEGVMDSVVLFASGEGPESRLEGFTLTGGRGSLLGFGQRSGGGIACIGTSPTLANLIITGNTATHGGGVHCFEGASPRLLDCWIHHNSGDPDGGGIFMRDRCHPTLERCVIESNDATVWAGGIYITTHCSPHLSACLLTDNRAGDKGGAIIAQAGCDPVFESCTIAGNSAGHRGGGIFMYHANVGGNYPVFHNSILWGDTPEEISIWDASSGDVSASYCDLLGGWPGVGNLDIAPLFLGPGLEDLHLQPGSPCIDAGDPDSPLDYDRSVIDMGALSTSVNPCPPPTNYCVGAPNSAGSGGLIGSFGSRSVSENDFVLRVGSCPAGMFGLFFYGESRDAFPFGNGVLCIGAGNNAIHRLTPPVLTDQEGRAQRLLDFMSPPASSGQGAIVPGSSWNFQFWYRDHLGGGAFFNLSSAMAVTFCP